MSEQTGEARFWTRGKVFFLIWWAYVWFIIAMVRWSEPSSR